MKSNELTQSILKAYLTYNPITGIFNAKHDTKSGAFKPAGRQLGSLHNQGYKEICINGTMFLAHRLAWLYTHGYLPDKPLMLDHIDRNKTNNAIANLRVVNRSENSKNKGIYSNNTSGHKGVSFDKSRSKWRAQININRKLKFLGIFKTKEEAIAARKQGEIDYKFHEVKERKQ